METHPPILWQLTDSNHAQLAYPEVLPPILGEQPPPLLGCSPRTPACFLALMLVTMTPAALVVLPPLCELHSVSLHQ